MFSGKIKKYLWRELNEYKTVFCYVVGNSLFKNMIPNYTLNSNFLTNLILVIVAIKSRRI